MEDLELLAWAQNYVEKMANGINPLDGSVIEDDSVLNNVRVSRCLFYVNGILKEIIAKGGLTKKNKSKAFVYDAIKASTVKIDARPITLSEIIRNIKDVFTDCKVPTFRQMAELLKAKGILIDNPEKGGTHYVAARQRRRSRIKDKHTPRLQMAFSKVNLSSRIFCRRRVKMHLKLAASR